MYSLWKLGSQAVAELWGAEGNQTPGYVGVANLPNQVHRKSVKKGFEFTLMVVGESGLGKSTQINSLFLTDLYPERVIPSAAEKIKGPSKLRLHLLKLKSEESSYA
ncbi:Septin-2 [Saguinus oedipus]|uniref:Septin-2 n=1 Tax=Saguinus oedipus TaxID=9490 RepID=A0ABQ9UFX6_SAGOE|nr:Septin-2 [Saguinus oedipus]